MTGREYEDTPVVSPGPIKDHWRWKDGTVDRHRAHLLITFGDDGNPVARIGRGTGHTFVVQFLASASDVPTEAQQEIDFYLTEWGGSDPWAYAIYHCGTASNLYSSVHWHYLPHGELRE